jgi:hypothetical protein
MYKIFLQYLTTLLHRHQVQHPVIERKSILLFILNNRDYTCTLYMCVFIITIIGKFGKNVKNVNAL